MAAVLIAGDVYDKAIPSEAATRMLDYFLSNLAEKNVYVYMVSGNHDSDERLDTLENWLSSLSLLLHSDIIAYEFPGYASDSEEYSDTLASETVLDVYFHMVGVMMKPPQKIVFIGKGAGCGVTLFLSYKIRKNYQIGGVVLINPIVNASENDMKIELDESNEWITMEYDYIEE